MRTYQPLWVDAYRSITDLAFNLFLVPAQFALLTSSDCFLVLALSVGYQALFVPLGVCNLGKFSYMADSPRQKDPALALACDTICRQASIRRREAGEGKGVGRERGGTARAHVEWRERERDGV